MPQLVNLLNKNIMTLIVALPKNDPEMAAAAVAAGADGLQLHLNHSNFGGFAEEKMNLEKIVKQAKLPVGVVPGSKISASEEEMKEMVKMGFDFFNMDLNYLPPFMLSLKTISKVLALNSKFTMDKLIGLGNLGADALDAAILPVSEWRKEMVVGDLQNYISMVISAGIPVIIPTQRSIRTSEVAIISDTGAKGLSLTSVVMGNTIKSIERAVKEFKQAADELG